VIGREGDIAEVERRLREGIHTLVTGPRRVGKTTVCNAVCERARRDDAVVIAIEVPERPDAAALLQLLIDRCNTISVAAAARAAWRGVRPLVERILGEQGIPLDLSQLDAEPGGLPTSQILSLPAYLHEQTGQPIVLFLDELQRAVDYADGEQVLCDLVDLYSGSADPVLLVDGSDERALESLLASRIGFGKLCDRLPLAPEIPAVTWRAALPGRFAMADLGIDDDALATLVAFGRGRPYATMTAARYAALNARKLGSQVVGAFEAEEAVAEARRHLAEDA
jgi:hypothetical protein